MYMQQRCIFNIFTLIFRNEFNSINLPGFIKYFANIICFNKLIFQYTCIYIHIVNFCTVFSFVVLTNNSNF